MYRILSALALVPALCNAVALPSETIEKRSGDELSFMMERSVAPGSGTDHGYFWSYWTLGQGTIDYENYDVGGYSVNWQNVGDFTAGKGWMPGAARTINYSGSFSTSAGNGLLSVYGWTVNPLIEYYILESYTTDPSLDTSQGFVYKGTVDSDGGTYKIYTAPRHGGSIIGEADFTQYWSIRTSTRTSGTITTANHFNAWANLGMPLGNFDASQWCYQILSTEGLWGSSGNSAMTVW